MRSLCFLKNTNLSTFKIEITDLVFGGDGIGKLNGKVCFVPLSAPGDVVEISITEDKRDFSRGQIERILHKSPLRIDPPCEYFAKCGGCNWQHLAYHTQLEMKEKLVTSLFRKSFGEAWTYRGIQRSPQEFHYRNKIGLKWDGKRVGYFHRKSHEHLSVSQCMIADETINLKIPALEEGLRQAAQKPHLEKTYFLYADSLHTELSFSQVNEAVNEFMKKDVLELVNGMEPSAFFDFYSGQGNFTFPIYEKLKEAFQVVATSAVEFDAQMVAEARRLSGKRKIRITHAKVEDFLRREKIPDKSLVLLDPPRMGCHALVMDALLHSATQKIIYVSCNPTTLHRDLKLLLKMGNYRLESMKCFDMFPQTDHIEVVAEIVPN